MHTKETITEPTTVQTYMHKTHAAHKKNVPPRWTQKEQCKEIEFEILVCIVSVYSLHIVDKKILFINLMIL